MATPMSEDPIGGPSSLRTPPRMSRYRSLRGKSVSEPRKKIDAILETAQLEPMPERPPSQFTVRASKRRSKSLSGVMGFGELKPFPAPPPVPQSPKFSLFHRPRTPSKSVISHEISQPPQTSDIQPPRTAPSPPFAFATAITTDSAINTHVEPDQYVVEPEAVEGVHVDNESRNPKDALEEERSTWPVDQELQADDPRQREEEEAARWADEVARLEAETDRILADQKRKDLARLHQQLLSEPSTPNVYASKPLKSPIVEKFAFLTRGRRSQANTLSPTSSTTASVDLSRAQSVEPNALTRTFTDNSLSLMTPPHSPLTASADNDKMVTVRCRESVLSLQVDLETSTVDILFQTSDSLKVPINTATSIVYECYAPLGLQRRLRRYERVTDVVYSWDHGDKNSLFIQPFTGSLDGDKELDMSFVPPGNVPNKGFTVLLQHLQRPGKWTKRYVTLLRDGHLYCSKRSSDPPPRLAASGGYITKPEVQSLCQLTDADIYTPADDQAKKTLKAPKKYVYAVKSQQRASAFASSITDPTQSYVHFFCTDDPAVAHTFSSLVQAWRSGHLVRERRESIARAKVQRAKAGLDKPPQITFEKHMPKKSVSHLKVAGHRVKISVDQTPYSIGEFQPLINLERFDKPIDEFGKDWIPDATQHKSITTTTVSTPPSTPGPVHGSGIGQALTDVPEEAREVEDVKDEASSTQSASTASETSEAPTPDSEVSSEDDVLTPRPLAPVKPQEPTIEPKPAVPKVEASSWFPSASAHTAKTKEAEAKAMPRPSTSSGAIGYFDHRSASSHAHGQNQGYGGADHDGHGSRRVQPQHMQARRNKPQPLTLRNLNGVPIGNGNQYLAELISVPTTPFGSPRFLEVPPRSATIRRDTTHNGGMSSPKVATRPSTSSGDHRGAHSAPMRSRSHTNLREMSSNNSSQHQFYQQPTPVPQSPGGGAGGRRPPEDPLPPLPPLPLNMRPTHGGSQSTHVSRVAGGHVVDYNEFPPVPSAAGQYQAQQQQQRYERGRDPRPRDMGRGGADSPGFDGPAVVRSMTTRI